jgi:nucleoside phosphorylase
MDNLISRITFDPGSKKDELTPIPWPESLEPKPFVMSNDYPFPNEVDVLVITWTAAEARALADVLTPGVESTDWIYYTTDFGMYLPQLTGRSPARESRRLGSWWLTQIGNKKVLCFKSELHPATDGPTVPTAQLVAQLIADCNPGAVITTGTAGGAGTNTLLGDVNVASVVHADFTTKLKKWPDANHIWGCSPLGNMPAVDNLIAANSAKIPANPRPPQMWKGHTVSTDFFAFDTKDDHYGLRAYDSAIRAVEMDDAAVFAGVPASTKAYSVRNASDPVMPDGSEASSKQAADIYQKYGYWTTINSAIYTWALIAGME